MCNSLALQLKSAEHLIDCAAEMIMDAAGVLKDAGDLAGMQRLETLAVTVAAEVTILQAQRGGGEQSDEAAA